MHVCSEKTVFMQKAIYYVSRLIAARGILELTDCRLNFQVSQLDSSFGFKSISIDLATVDDVAIRGGDLHPRVIITSGRRYEFVLPKARELHAHLKQLCCSSVTAPCGASAESNATCRCGRSVDRAFNYCPWCGTDLDQT